MDMQLSTHFSLAEFTRSQAATRAGLSNQPTSLIVIANLRRTAALLEQVRTVLGGKPVFVDSGYRSPKVNGLVGGSANSAHCDGRAVDFICPEFGTPKQICVAILQAGLVFDQLIYEGTWVHVAVPWTGSGRPFDKLRANGFEGKPRGEVLTAVFGKKGTSYLTGLV